MGCCILIAMVFGALTAFYKACYFLKSKNNAQEWRLEKYQIH